MVGTQALRPSGHCYSHYNIIKPYPYGPNQNSTGRGVNSAQDRVKEDESPFSYSDLKLIPNALKDASNSKAYPNEMGNPSHRSHPFKCPTNPILQAPSN